MRGKSLPYGPPRGAAVAGTVPLIRPFGPPVPTPFGLRPFPPDRGNRPPGEGFQAVLAVHHRMTREDQQQAPCRWGLPFCPCGTRGDEHKGAELCPLTVRRSSFPKAHSSGPRKTPGVRGTVVWRSREACRPISITTAPRRLFRPFLAGQKWAHVPRLSSFVSRPPYNK